jgi:hypothetical protein
MAAVTGTGVVVDGVLSSFTDGDAAARQISGGPAFTDDVETAAEAAAVAPRVVWVTGLEMSPRAEGLREFAAAAAAARWRSLKLSFGDAVDDDEDVFGELTERELTTLSCESPGWWSASMEGCFTSSFPTA